MLPLAFTQEFSFSALFLDHACTTARIIGRADQSSKKPISASRLYRDVKPLRLSPTVDLEPSRMINDFCVYSMLSGNDFLPSLTAAKIADGNLNTLLDLYRGHLLEFESTANNPEPYLMNSGCRLAWNNFLNLLRLFALHEIRFSHSKSGSKWPLRLDSEVLSQFWASRSEYWSLKMGWKLDTAVPDSSSPWSFGMYQNLGPPKDSNDCTSDDLQRLTHMCRSYVKQLFWTFEYYFIGSVSFEDFYPYHYVPTAVEILLLLGEFPLQTVEDLLRPVNSISLEKSDQLTQDMKSDTSRGPVRPFVQLLSVIPPQNRFLVPRTYHDIYDQGVLAQKGFFPTKVPVDNTDATVEWEGVSLLPFMPLSQLLKEMEEAESLLPLSEDEVQRNESHEATILIPRHLGGAQGFAEMGLVDETEAFVKRVFKLPKNRPVLPAVSHSTTLPHSQAALVLSGDPFMSKGVRVHRRQSRNPSLYIKIPPPTDASIEFLSQVIHRCIIANRRFIVFRLINLVAPLWNQCVTQEDMESILADMKAPLCADETRDAKLLATMKQYAKLATVEVSIDPLRKKRSRVLGVYVPCAPKDIVVDRGQLPRLYCASSPSSFHTLIHPVINSSGSVQIARGTLYKSPHVRYRPEWMRSIEDEINQRKPLHTSQHVIPFQQAVYQMKYLDRGMHVHGIEHAIPECLLKKEDQPDDQADNNGGQNSGKDSRNRRGGNKKKKQGLQQKRANPKAKSKQRPHTMPPLYEMLPAQQRAAERTWWEDTASFIASKIEGDWKCPIFEDLLELAELDQPLPFSTLERDLLQLIKSPSSCLLGELLIDVCPPLSESKDSECMWDYSEATLDLLGAVAEVNEDTTTGLSKSCQHEPLKLILDQANFDFGHPAVSSSSLPLHPLFAPQRRIKDLRCPTPFDLQSMLLKDFRSPQWINLQTICQHLGCNMSAVKYLLGSHEVSDRSMFLGMSFGLTIYHDVFEPVYSTEDNVSSFVKVPYGIPDFVKLGCPLHPVKVVDRAHCLCRGCEEDPPRHHDDLLLRFHPDVLLFLDDYRKRWPSIFEAIVGNQNIRKHQFRKIGFSEILGGIIPGALTCYTHDEEDDDDEDDEDDSESSRDDQGRAEQDMDDDLPSLSTAQVKAATKRIIQCTVSEFQKWRSSKSFGVRNYERLRHGMDSQAVLSSERTAALVNFIDHKTMSTDVLPLSSADAKTWSTADNSPPSPFAVFKECRYPPTALSLLQRGVIVPHTREQCSSQRIDHIPIGLVGTVIGSVASGIHPHFIPCEQQRHELGLTGEGAKAEHHALYVLLDNHCPSASNLFGRVPLGRGVVVNAINFLPLPPNITHSADRLKLSVKKSDYMDGDRTRWNSPEIEGPPTARPPEQTIRKTTDAPVRPIQPCAAGQGKGGLGCHNCGRQGHIARRCTRPAERRQP
eukprot:GHVH01015154.1.p1 GENE.GHVH01015154.1~~GHVH01015154.1.p1  ORF type:complete len:1419 (-),score=213.83 GHVH01015154.1:231-4487(-)